MDDEILFKANSNFPKENLLENTFSIGTKKFKIKKFSKNIRILH